MGPSFACLYLAYLEKQFFAKHKGSKPDLFRRYIDDLHPRQAQSFLKEFYKLDSDLKFTWSEIEADETPFLGPSMGPYKIVQV